MLILCLTVVYLAHLPEAQLAILLPSRLDSMRGKKSQMEHIMSQDKDRDITYWLPQWANQTKLVECLFSLLLVKTHFDGDKHRWKLKRLSQTLFFFQVQIQASSSTPQSPPPTSEPGRWVMEGCDQFITVLFSALSSHFSSVSVRSFLHASVSHDKPVTM